MNFASPVKSTLKWLITISAILRLATDYYSLDNFLQIDIAEEKFYSKIGNDG